MIDGNINSKLVSEEKKAVKLFLWLFFIFYYSVDAFYFYVLPIYNKSLKFGIPRTGLGIWLYILVSFLLVISISILRTENIYRIKYILFFGYIFIDFLDDMLTYFGTSRTFGSGNIVELLFVLFSPIFVNKKYFWVVFIGIEIKYILIGITLHQGIVLFPIIIFAVMGAIAYMLLIRFFSYLISLINAHEELSQKERLAVIGEMAASVGHEIRNPLAALKGFIQLQNEQHPNTNQYYPIMVQEIDRINSIVNDLLYLGRPKIMQFEMADIKEIIDYTLSICEQQADKNSIVFETRFESSLPLIECDRRQLTQVFLNIIKNAIEAMAEGGKIRITGKVLKKEKVQILIEDEGCGIPEEQIPDLGSPFYTTKKNGTGLGLMVTNRIVGNHDGIMNIQSTIGQGTKVEIVLPIERNKKL